jgi:hypothetical protein
MSAKPIHVLAVGMIVGLIGADLNAAAHGVNSDEVPAADLKLEDPTVLTRRVWLETEWNKFTDGTHTVEETFGQQWAWRVSENQDWGVRLKLPAKIRVGSDVPGVADVGGLGDVKIAAGTAFRLSKVFRLGGALDLQMPTGRHEVSDNVWRIRESGGMGWDITPWLTFSPSFDYNQSFSEETGAAPLHFLEAFFPFTFILPNKWAVSAGYENKTDFQNDNYVAQRAKLGVTKELESIPLSFSLSAKRTFDSGEKEFQMNFIVTYFFR